MQSVYVAGTGITRFGKDPRSLAAMAGEAAQQALAEAWFDTVDAIYLGAMA